MARIRTIKPEFFTSEDIVALSPMARLLYIALWCEADREGRFVWKTKTFKMRYFPADECDIEAMCAEITLSDLVVRYGEGYAYIPSFLAHQHLNPRETVSQLPGPGDKVTRHSRVGTRHSRDSDAQGGREGKGKEGKTRDASREPVGFKAFWDVYPNRSARQNAVNAWAKLDPDEQLQGVIVKAVSAQAKGDGWQKNAGQFVPLPATWLNGKRWTDEIPSATVLDIFAGAR